jgi:hypothetical protein
MLQIIKFCTKGVSICKLKTGTETPVVGTMSKRVKKRCLKT